MLSLVELERLLLDFKVSFPCVIFATAYPNPGEMATLEWWGRSDPIKSLHPKIIERSMPGVLVQFTKPEDMVALRNFPVWAHYSLPTFVLKGQDGVRVLPEKFSWVRMDVDLDTKSLPLTVIVSAQNYLDLCTMILVKRVNSPRRGFQRIRHFTAYLYSGDVIRILQARADFTIQSVGDFMKEKEA
jgi:hypothetical protein